MANPHGRRPLAGPIRLALVLAGVLFAVAPAPAGAGAPAVLLRPGADRVDLPPGIELLRDPGSTRAAAELWDAPFAPPPRDLDVGLVPGAVWVRVTVENPSERPAAWLLTFDAPGIDRIDAWWRRGEVEVRARGGIALRPAERGIAARGPWHELPLTLDAGARTTLLARLESSGPLSVAASARTPAAAAQALAGAIGGSGLASGALAALGLLALAVAVALRDRTAGALGAFCLALAGVLACASGLGLAVLWPDARRSAVLAPALLAAVAAGAGLRLARGLLGARLRGIPHAAAAFAGAAALIALVHPRAGQVVAGIAVLSATAIAGWWSARGIRAGEPAAGAFALGVAPLAAVSIADVLGAAGILPARAPGGPALAATACLAAAVLAALVALRLRRGDRLAGATLRRAADARAALQRAVDARTAELADAIEALRREGAARRDAEAARTAAEEALRRERERPAAAARPRPAAEPPRPPAVLLVEEDEPVRDACARLLERLGYRVLPASDAREALRAAEAAAGVEVAVLDVVQRGMGGKELADRLTARWPDLRVLLTAGEAHDVLGPAPGGFAFLPKPYAPLALAAKISELLRDPAARRSA